MAKPLISLVLTVAMVGTTCLAQSASLAATNAAPEWTTNLVDARAIAKAVKKPIYVFMTDNSKECVQMQKSFLESGIFQRFAKDNLVLFHLTVPQVPKGEKIPKAIDSLLSRVRRKYPGMVMIDDKGKFLATVTFKAPKKHAEYLFDLKDIIEKKGYAVDDAALEGHTPPKLPTPGKKK